MHLYPIRLSGAAGATLGAGFFDKADTDKLSAETGTAAKTEGKAAQGASLTDDEKLAAAAAATSVDIVFVHHGLDHSHSKPSPLI